MSQNPLSDSFLNLNEPLPKPTPFHCSQISNNSLNILNKISAISIKNLSKSNVSDQNDFSFLDSKKNKKDNQQLPLISDGFCSKDINKEMKMEAENEDNIDEILKVEGFIEAERKDDQENIGIKAMQYEQKGAGENKEFPFSNKKPPTIKIAEKSFISNNSQNFDFLVKEWGEYFFDEEPTKLKIEDDYRHIIIRTVYQCYNYPEFSNLLIWGPEKKYGVIDCFIDYQKLKQISLETSAQSTKSDPLKSELFQILSEILDYLTKSPSDLLNSFNIALDAIRVKILEKTKRRVITRIYNLPNLISLPDIKSNIIGDFISIKGVVLKIAPVKLLTKSMKFTCLECHKSFLKKFVDGIYISPTSCESAPKCKSKTFQPDKTTAQTILYQRIKLQEIDEESGSGRVPRSLDCELKENLVNCLISGDTVILNGTMKTEALEDNKGGGVAGKKNQQGLFNMYLDVNSLLNGKDTSKMISDQNMSSLEEEYTEEDLRIFESLMQFAQDRRLFPLLVKSFCPSIYGHEIVKAGLLLAIVGGSADPVEKKPRSEKFLSRKEPTFRKDCHVLLIGDPGLGKSQLLKYVANIAPRSVYVCGKSSSTVGLTVAVQKDSASGEGSLEAGALVLSDQGVCCIDEFDKMEKEHLALLESMEQQTVSIAKSGVLCSLQTRTTIIASANPQGGNYNKQKNIRDNIKISNAILSRFDLIFLMLDEPDPKRDQKLSEHVMKLHNHRKRRRTEFENTSFNNGFLQNNTDNFSQIHMNFDDFVYNNKNNQSLIRKSFEKNPDLPDCIEGQFVGNHYQSLSERLAKMCEGIGKTLQTCVLRKYISYIKKNIHPFLSGEASEILKSFYLRLRENNDSASSITITTRQLESLIRLSQARAKLEMRTEVTKEDALEVVELMQESLFDALEDVSFTQGNKLAGKPLKNMTKLTNIGALSVPKQTKVFVEKLNDEAMTKGSDLFEYQDLLRIAKGLNLSMGSDFASYIDRLNYENFLIMKSSKLYQLVRKKEF